MDDRPRGGDPRIVPWATRDVQNGFISLANRICLPLPSLQIDLNTRLQHDTASHPTCPSQPSQTHQFGNPVVDLYSPRWG